MRFLTVGCVLLATTAAFAADIPDKLRGFSLRAEPSGDFTALIATSSHGVASSEWAAEESRIAKEISRVRDMGSLVKRNVSTGGGESLIIINGHVDVLDKFDRAYLLYTRECVDQACKQFKVSEFSIYFEHPVEGEVESKSGPDEAEARCKETRTATTTLLCVKPDEFTVDVKGKGSYIVSPEAYGRVVPGQQASFSGFGPIHWTPVF